MIDSSEPFWKTLKNLFQLIPRRGKRRMGALVLAMLLGAMLETVSLSSIPVFLSILVDPERTASFAPWLPIWNWIDAYPQDRVVLFGAVALVGIFIIKNTYLGFIIFSGTVVLRDICVDISTRLFRAYMHAPYRLHSQRNATLSIRNLTSELDQLRVTINSTMVAIREGFILVLLSVVLVLADPAIAIPTVVFLSSAAIGAMLIIRRRLAEGGRRKQFFRGQQMQIIQQGIGSLKIARVLGHEPYLNGQFSKATKSMERAFARNRFLPATPRLFLETVAIAAILIIVGLALALGRETGEILPILALIAVSIVRLVPVLTQITTATAQLAAGRAAISVIFKDLNNFEAENAVQPHYSVGGIKNAAFQALDVSNISFTFPNAGEPTLQNINISILPGQSVGLIGPSGAGKSTLVDIVMGLGEPSSGEVLLDGRNIHRDRRVLRGLFGYVPQDIFLLDDTIRQNIGFGIPADELDPNQLQQCLDDAQLADFVAALPQGLDTVVGDRGARLSGGQRQRLGIARALYHNPAILVLDEATSALDTATEEAVVAAIKRLKGSITTLTIAHRLSTLADCDVVYRIESGKLTAQGTLADVS